MKYPLIGQRPPMPVQTMGRPLQNAQGMAPQPSFMDRLGEMSPALLQAGAGLLSGRTGAEQFALGAQGFGQGAQGIKDKREAELKKNKTFQWLEKNATPEELEAVRAGLTTATDLFKAKTSQTAQKPTSALQEYQYAKSQGYEGSFMDYKAANKGGVTVNLPGAPMIGTIPTGYAAKKDDQGNFSMAPVPGGPAALEAEKAARQQEIGKQSKARSGNVVIEDIDRALTGLNEGFLPSAGVVGGALAKVPGTQAYDVGALIQTVKANSGFDRLQAMRDSSPTGGALGAINQSEMALLQSALGNLEQSQSKEQLEYNLKRVRQIYDEIINGPQGAPASPDGWQDIGNGVRIRQVK